MDRVDGEGYMGFNPSNKEVLSDEMENNIRFAMQTLQETKQFIPMVIGMCANNIPILVPFLWKTDEEKLALSKVIKNKFRESGVISLTHIEEAWFLLPRHRALYDKEGLRPSEHPDRRESILIVYISKVERLVVFIPFRRVDGEIIFEERNVMKDNDFVDVLWGDIFKGGDK